MSVTLMGINGPINSERLKTEPSPRELSTRRDCIHTAKMWKKQVLKKRNSKCPCDSGKKVKKCCATDESTTLLVKLLGKYGLVL